MLAPVWSDHTYHWVIWQPNCCHDVLKLCWGSSLQLLCGFSSSLSSGMPQDHWHRASILSIHSPLKSHWILFTNYMILSHWYFPKGKLDSGVWLPVNRNSLMVLSGENYYFFNSSILMLPSSLWSVIEVSLLLLLMRFLSIILSASPFWTCAGLSYRFI